MALLPEPYEYLDLHDGEHVKWHITDYLIGEANIAPKNPTARHIVIHMEQNQLTAAPPAGHPITVTVPVTRLYGTRLDKPSHAAYLDVSSKTLQATLKPLLDSGVWRGRSLMFTANGHAPAKRYSVELI